MKIEVSEIKKYEMTFEEGELQDIFNAITPIALEKVKVMNTIFYPLSDLYDELTKLGFEYQGD